MLPVCFQDDQRQVPRSAYEGPHESDFMIVWEACGGLISDVISWHSFVLGCVGSPTNNNNNNNNGNSSPSGSGSVVPLAINGNSPSPDNSGGNTGALPSGAPPVQQGTTVSQGGGGYRSAWNGRGTRLNMIALLSAC